VLHFLQCALTASGFRADPFTMKSSLLSNTASLGIVPLRWLSFFQTATATYVPLSAYFTPSKIQMLAQAGTSYYPALPT